MLTAAAAALALSGAPGQTAYGMRAGRPAMLAPDRSNVRAAERAAGRLLP